MNFLQQNKGRDATQAELQEERETKNASQQQQLTTLLSSMQGCRQADTWAGSVRGRS
jgi:hypothetical protein